MVGMLLRGQLVGERYRVEDVIGNGGMGTVIAAIDTHSGRHVALKVPHRSGARVRARVAREQRALRRLAHPNVAQLLETARLDDGRPVLVFERLVGEDLATRLAAQHTLSVAAAVTLVRATCAGIAHAHAAGLVHRDLKPANLFLAESPDGEHLKILDFGIARLAEHAELGAEATVTAENQLVGSPAYMPPEQLRPSLAPDHRSDIWALGVILYELVVGRPPFEATSFPDLCLKILLDDPPPMPAHVPEEVAVIIRRCLEKEPSDRFQRADELANALAAHAHVSNISAMPVTGAARSWVVVAAVLALCCFGAPAEQQSFRTNLLAPQVRTIDHAVPSPAREPTTETSTTHMAPVPFASAPPPRQRAHPVRHEPTHPAGGDDDPLDSPF